MGNRESSPRNEQPEPQNAAPPPIFPERGLEERRIAWVGKSVSFKGDLISLEDMTIDGRVEGTIELREHTLTIGPDAHINADIVADAVTVFGTVTGKITVGKILNIRETAAVEGQISCRRLAMADGALLRGRVETTV